MASLLRRFSITNSNSNPDSTSDSSPNSSPPTGRIYGARDWQLNATHNTNNNNNRNISDEDQSTNTTNTLRKPSLSSSPDDTSSSSFPSSSSTTTGRIYGARDWRQGSISQGITAEEDAAVRRQSIVDDYTSSSVDEDMPLMSNAAGNGGQMSGGGRKYSVPYGPRHYVLADRERQGSTWER